MESSSYVCIWNYEGKTWSDTARLEGGELLMFNTELDTWEKTQFEEGIQLYFVEVVWTIPN